MDIKEINEKNMIFDLLLEFRESFYTPLEIKNVEAYSEKLFNFANVYLAIKDNKHIGLLVFYANRDITSYLARIVVKRNYQGQGIGEVLLKYFIDYSLNHSFKKMRLEVDKNNFRAINLYNKYGFKVEKEVGKGIVYMCLNIENDL